VRQDADLAADLRAGDDHAFALLYERHKGDLFALAARMLGDAETARDLVQDVFLAIYQRRDQLERPESFRSWLFAIGRNACLSRLRRPAGPASLEDVSEEPVSAGTPPDRALEAREECTMLRRALARLRPEFREVLILREYEGLPYREIAAVLGATESAVKSRLFQARRALHGVLGPALAGGR
jgi:RNA polymerase sigma-70 factor (ECF subfamily)